MTDPRGPGSAGGTNLSSPLSYNSPYPPQYYSGRPATTNGLAPGALSGNGLPTLFGPNLLWTTIWNVVGPVWTAIASRLAPLPERRAFSWRSRAEAQSVSCLGNLKEWGLIFELYTEQNDQRFFSGPLDAAWDDWVEILEPYYDGKEQIMCCPMAVKTRAKGGQGVFAAWDDGEGDYGSFGLNAWICDLRKGIVFGQDNYWRSPLAPGAARIPVLLDSISIASWPDSSSLPADFNGQFPQTPILAEQMKINMEPYDGMNQVWAGGPGGIGTTNTPLVDVQREVKLGNGSFTWKIQDMERKANINSAGENLLQQAFMLMGVDAGDMTPAISSVLDWIDPEHRPPGAAAAHAAALHPAAPAPLLPRGRPEGDRRGPAAEPGQERDGGIVNAGTFSCSGKITLGTEK